MQDTAVCSPHQWSSIAGKIVHLLMLPTCLLNYCIHFTNSQVFVVFASQCFTVKSDSLTLRAKQLVSHFAFGTSMRYSHMHTCTHCIHTHTTHMHSYTCACTHISMPINSSASSHVMSMDYTKPLLIPAGSDALGQIGVPPVPSGELSRISARLGSMLACQCQTCSCAAGGVCKDPGVV